MIPPVIPRGDVLAVGTPVARRSLPVTIATRVLWIALIVLVALALTSVALRWVFPGDAAAQLEPLRQSIFAMAHIPTGSTTARMMELAQFEGRYQANRLATLVHILPGAIFIALALVQLSRPIRSRFPLLHRWTGRFLMTLAIFTGIAALFFGIGMPFGGPAEAIIIAIVAVWFFTSLVRAYIAIRRGDVATHREWMLRAVASAIGVAVVRVVGVAADLTLTPAGLSAADTFVVALWIGWATTIGVCEWWIYHTRPERV
jgi:uncharacterized membrane protein